MSSPTLDNSSHAAALDLARKMKGQLEALCLAGECPELLHPGFLSFLDGMRIDATQLENVLKQPPRP